MSSSSTTAPPPPPSPPEKDDDDFDQLVDKLGVILREYIREDKAFAREIVALSRGCGCEDGERMARQFRAYVEKKYPSVLPQMPEAGEPEDSLDPIACALDDHWAGFHYDDDAYNDEDDEDASESDEENQDARVAGQKKNKSC